jgi:NAD(P)-dependent dehydrogenase (short-subunit alcohol dehydrogenase family)
VVGASSGIGRQVALAAAAEGAAVVVAARRFDRLRDVVQEAGAGVDAVQCDVRSAISTELAVKAAVQHLEAIDTVVFATGINHLGLLEQTDHDAWMTVLETNLVGAAMVTRAVLPYLRRATGTVGSMGGRIGYLSSHSVPRPWPGLGAYAASKAGLDTLVQAWRTECPDVTFTRIVVGPTITGMADAWDPEVAAAMFELWQEMGYFDGHTPAPVEEVAESIVAWMADDQPPDDVALV